MPQVAYVLHHGGRIMHPARGPGWPGHMQAPDDAVRRTGWAVDRGRTTFSEGVQRMVMYYKRLRIHMYLFISTWSSPSEAAMPKVAYVFFHHIHVILGWLLQRSR